MPITSYEYAGMLFCRLKGCSMIKRCLVFCWFIIASCRIPGVAQSDRQQSILTDVGILTVSQNIDELDMINLPACSWNYMVSGTSYTTRRLISSKTLKLTIEIASRKSGSCRKGIGFSCSIFPSVANDSCYPLRVNDKYRFCRILLSMDGPASVCIVFLDEVDWQSLANGP